MVEMDVQVLRRICNDRFNPCRMVGELQRIGEVTFETNRRSVAKGTVVRCHEEVQKHALMITIGREIGCGRTKSSGLEGPNGVSEVEKECTIF